jgi:hypothetical protein
MTVEQQLRTCCGQAIRGDREAGDELLRIQCVLKLEDAVRFLYRLPGESLIAPPLLLVPVAADARQEPAIGPEGGMAE